MSEMSVADTRDHAGVDERVGEHDEPGQHLGQGGERRLVGHIAGGEQQRRLLGVEVGQLVLQPDVPVGGARDVAGAAAAGARLVQRRAHGVDHHGILALAQVVVGAPNHDLLLGPVVARAHGVGKAAPAAADVGEDAVAALCVHLLDGGAEGFFFFFDFD